jgi:fido (protein-threonine AMPylation protein)
MEQYTQEQTMLQTYYEGKEKKAQKSMNSKDHDLVSNRIKEVITDSSFSLQPTFLQNIHTYLFQGIYEDAGKYRDYNITKKEFILNNDTVHYTPFYKIEDCLTYDFDNERKHKHKYRNKTPEQIISQIALFNSRIWEDHPFLDGNTRTTEVFIVKYLRSLGYDIDNELYKSNSLYFRNALVRSCYSNSDLNINSTDIYLLKFYQNLLLGTNHKLRSRDLIVPELFTNKPKTKSRILTPTNK